MSEARLTEARTFDVRPGQNGWGHALHAGTFRPAPPRVERRGLLRKRVEIARVSVLVHCHKPRLGDLVIYEGQSGKTWTTKIVDIEPQTNVDDMFKLTLEEAPAGLDAISGKGG